ncbi:hypothetical protein LCGC14_2513170, partial [marine sediment metagenome]
IYLILFIVRFSILVLLLHPYFINIFDSLVWISFVFLIFSAFRVFNLKLQSPSFIQYIKEEIISTGLKIKRGFKTGVYYLILNSITICVYLLAIVDIIDINGDFYFLLLLSTICIPIIFGISLDKLTIRLNKFRIRLSFRWIKREGETMLAIYLASSRVCWRVNKLGVELFGIVSKRHWLLKKERKILPKIALSYQFLNYSSSFNFQGELLHICNGIRDWDIAYNFLKYSKKGKVRKALEFIDSHINITPEDSNLYFMKCMIIIELIQDEIEVNKNITTFKTTIKKALSQLSNSKMFETKIWKLIKNEPILLKIFSEILQN